MGIPQVAGRDFSESDTVDSVPVAIVSEELVQAAVRRWRARSAGAFGSTSTTPTAGTTWNGWWSASSATSSRRWTGPSARPSSSRARSVPAAACTFFVRTQQDPLSLATSVTGIVHAMEPEAPVDVRTLEEVVGSTIARPRAISVLVGVFALVALALAAVGVYGVMAYSVRERTQEIGVRMALGATATSVLRLVLGQALRLVFIGVAAGLVAAGAAHAAARAIVVRRRTARSVDVRRHGAGPARCRHGRVVRARAPRHAHGSRRRAADELGRVLRPRFRVLDHEHCRPNVVFRVKALVDGVTVVSTMIKPVELESEGGRDTWDTIVAASAGDVATLRRLLERDPRLARAGYWYAPAVHFAAREGHVEAVRLLLDAGADPERNGLNDRNLIEMARERGHEQIAQMLEQERERRGESSRNRRSSDSSGSGARRGRSRQRPPRRRRHARESRKPARHHAAPLCRSRRQSSDGESSARSWREHGRAATTGDLQAIDFAVWGERGKSGNRRHRAAARLARSNVRPHHRCPRSAISPACGRCSTTVRPESARRGRAGDGHCRRQSNSAMTTSPGSCSSAARIRDGKSRTRQGALRSTRHRAWATSRW